MQEKLNQYAKLVGKTPMAKVNYEFRGKKKSAYFKLEYFNPSGSIKDRMALRIMQDAIKSNAFKPGSQIAEATSGNTGIAFSALGAFCGIKVNIFMPDWMSEERKKLITSYGANLIEVSAAQGGFAGSVELANEFAAKFDAFLPHQFENQSNLAAHTATGAEIISDLASVGLKPECFVAGVGTGGTVMGVGRVLKSLGASIHPVEPEGCASMSIPGQNAEHLIQGIGDGFVPEIVKLDELDSIIVVNDLDSVKMAQKLASIGLGVGISSGANFLAACMMQEQRDCVCVSVFADDSKKYLSTPLMSQQDANSEHLSEQIKLIDFEIIKGK